MDLVRTCDWELVEPLVRELEPELGPELRASMRCWCGLEERPYPLVDWQVYFLGRDWRLYGLFGHYQDPSEDRRNGWVGWLGVARSHRHRGHGREMVSFVEEQLRKSGVLLLRVHTSRETPGAIAFYEELGFGLEAGLDPLKLNQRSVDKTTVVMLKWIGLD